MPFGSINRINSQCMQKANINTSL
ncbi:protein of unknown function [Azospirillum baldaniorum]|uniref:Uncharacterized protein n=1 Tax=Azospirillum baldaniorum TaxID=1064539 RepID=A0A9P1JNU6_9PROT|nr:protein of unknown function [Azospirillum baldaniorum]